MRWHYIKKDEWPEETDTMVLCECHFVDIFPEYHVAMYSDFEGVKDFIVEDVKDHHAYHSIRNEVYAWVLLDEIIEEIHFSEIYEEAKQKCCLVAQAASGDRIELEPTGDMKLTCILSHDLKIAKNILENDLLPPSPFDPDWPSEHEIEKRKYVRVEVWCDHKMIGWVDNTNESYETV